MAAEAAPFRGMAAKKHRRSRQMVLVLIACGVLTALVVTALKSSEASASFVAKVKHGGGFIEYQERGPRWLRRLLGEHYPLKSAVMITFGANTTDEDLAQIGVLPGLTSVNLSVTKVKGPGLVYLKNLSKLEALDLTKSYVSDDGLENLEGLQALTTLTLAWLDVTDAGLEHLRSLKSLKILGLPHTKVTDRGVEALTGLRLSWLDVRWTSMTTNGVAQLRGNSQALDVVGP